ncbi:hypothetical protein Ancab_022020 [Ancistrocladus abbreviatus]
MTGKKRVWFKDHEENHSPGHRPDASSVPHYAAEALGLGDPKTSEYAFFKKFKHDVTRNIDSYKWRKDSIRLKDRKSTDHHDVDCHVFLVVVVKALGWGRGKVVAGFMEDAGMDNTKHKGSISKSHVKRASATVPDSFLSRQWAPLRSSDITRKVNDSCKNLKSSSPLKSQTPICLDSFLSSSANASTTTDVTFSGVICFPCSFFGCFLRKLNTMYGSPPLPMIVNPSPLSHEDAKHLTLCQHSESLEIRQVGKTTKLEPFASPEPSTQFKGSLIPRKFPRAEESQILNKGVSAYSDTLGERCPLQQMVEGPYARLIGFAERPLLGSKGREAEEVHLLNDHHNQLFPKWKGNYDSFATFGADMTTLECERARCQFLNAVSSRYWCCKSEDRSLSTWNSCGDNSSPATSTNRNLLDYKKRDPDGNLHGESALCSYNGNRFHAPPLPKWQVQDYESFAAFSADMTILEHESAWGQFFNDVSSRCWPSRSEGSTLPIWNTFDGFNSFPATSTDRNLLDYRRRESDYNLEDQAALVSDTWSGFDLFGNMQGPLPVSALNIEQVDYDNSLKNHRSSGLVSPMELDESKGLNDLVIKSDLPHTVFLGWDVNKLRHMLDFSSTSSNQQQDVFPIQSMLLNKHYWYNPENFAPPRSLFPSRLQLGELVSSSSAGVDAYGYQDCCLGRLYTEQKKFPVAGSDTGPLTLSQAPKQISLFKDNSFQKILDSSGFCLPPQNHNWPNMMYEQTHPSVEAFLPSFTPRSNHVLKYMSMTDSFPRPDFSANGAFCFPREEYANPYLDNKANAETSSVRPSLDHFNDLCSPTNLHISPYRQYPLQLHELKWNETEGKTCYTGSEDNLS